ncbi:MAG: creatininase family protein [Planctomycetota bacterium]
MLWIELSSPQVDALDRSTPVVIPLGSCEQHGRHLPLSVDTTQVQAIAGRLDQRLGDQAVFLPALWLGSSHHHLDFPGTVSVRPSLYAELIQDVARSILRAGFTRLFFLNGHGGNELPAQTGLAELIVTDDAADAASLAFASWWSAGADALQPDKHGLTQPGISHACEVETSLMLALRPDLVDTNTIQPTAPKFVSPNWHCEQGGKLRVFHSFQRLTTHGHMGSPEAATTDKGRSMLDALTDELADVITDFASWPTLPAGEGQP